MDCSAFVQPSFSSAFTPSRARRAAVSRRPMPATPSRIVMADGEKKPFFRNPFARKPKNVNEPPTTFMAPQPGDPGYKGSAAKKPVAETSTPKTGSSPVKLPVASGQGKRGFDLLKEDILKSAPERAGVGRQDAFGYMRPQAGEPGYKPAAYQTVKVSTLGISTFSDDKNYVGNVGGLEAVKKAALEVKSGKTAKQIKKEALKKAESIPEKPEAPKVYDVPDYLKPIPEDSPKRVTTSTSFTSSSSSSSESSDLPDYLKPLPEDSPRKGMSWKNY